MTFTGLVGMVWLSTLISVTYLLLPAIALGWTFRQARRTRSAKPWVALTTNAVIASILSTAINFRYAIQVGGSLAAVRPTQVLLGFYLAVGVLWMFRGVGIALKSAFDRLFLVHLPIRRLVVPVAPAASVVLPPDNPDLIAPAPVEVRAVDVRPVEVRSVNGWIARAVVSTMLRAVVLFAATLAYVISVGMVYRPRLASGGNPLRTMGATYEDVRFAADFAPTLAGWWIPAGAQPASEKSASWGKRTVILCHGVGIGKVTQLPLARELHSAGYNILAFDFRGFGDSGGQLTSFGDAERADVLSAVRWLRLAHPEGAERIFGVGTDTGGAALIAAAADNSADGRSIDAIAVLGAYDNLAEWSDWLTREIRIPMLHRLVEWAAVPLANLHTGARLASFSPGDLVDHVAPRPLFVVHARGDSLVPFEDGVELFDRASQPKLRYWVGQRSKTGTWMIPTGPDGKTELPADEVHLLQDENLGRTLKLFFEREGQKL